MQKFETLTMVSKPSRGTSVVMTLPHARARGSSSDRLDQIFFALSSPTRRAILARLCRGEYSVTELARPFDMSLPAISKHLRILREAGVVTMMKGGRTHVCRIAPEPLKDAERWMAFYRGMWERQLASLAEFLKASKGARN